MDAARLLPLVLGLAWLLPLASFAAIVLLGPRMGKAGRGAGFLATAAILAGFVLSLTALGIWAWEHPISPVVHGGTEHAAQVSIEPISGDWYRLGVFGSFQMTIGYYIDGLTIAMFAMVTLVASCIHVYSFGYMHEELHDVTDPQVRLANGQPLRRRGRFHRFYQYLSLFCFSMLGLVLAGNVVMVFVFWELVGICSYLLIGFYIERTSASNAANKAFIVNRVGDFGMIIGLMAVWTGFGTFSFGDYRGPDDQTHPGIFSQVRPAAEHYRLRVPDGMVALAAREEVAEIVRAQPNTDAARQAIAARVPEWRRMGYGYWLLVIAGLGIFCGCVGKSAQFPLHVWLPDAMEGPTPVSALIHAATMVAAGVYLVGRFYPAFTPEVLLIVACIGCFTLLLAASIALVATDIKRVLAYSTVSQLGYMMLALGVGGWLAGMFHLFTHAFFKSLLFLGSGSVIHACHTNEMTEMGGLRKKMPWTAYTMLAGCLAIAGAGVPLVIGTSGYYSKDYIVAQLLSFRGQNAAWGCMFYAAVVGAGMTAFYMFRLWYMTFAGRPRDEHVYAHAHESPRVMVVPLVILAALAVAAGWNLVHPSVGLEPLLEQARPVGTAEGAAGGLLWSEVNIPAEHLAHGHDIHVSATIWAFSTALAGFLLATAFYGLRILSAENVRRATAPVYHFLLRKWWFDELYQAAFIRPTLWLATLVAAIDRKGIDWVADNSARLVSLGSRLDDWFDRWFVDGMVNRIADGTYALGLRLRTIQTGSLRQYVMFLVVGTVALFVLVSLYWSYTVAQI